MTDKRLKSIAERIEKLMDERDAIQGDIRDVYAEAKSAGYVPKVLRKAITRKRMDPGKRDEEDTILDLYEDALSPTMRRAVQMAAAGASARQIETETGVDQATVARSVSLNKKSETPKPEDGGDGITDAAGRPPGHEGESDDAPDNLRVPEADRGADVGDGQGASGGQGVQRCAGRVPAGGAGQDVRDPGASVERDVGERGDHASPGRDAARVGGSGLDLAHNEVQPPATPSVGAVAASSPRVAPNNPAEDDLVIPHFLLRRREGAET